MARVLILGGGFGGVVAAESLVKQLTDDHQITNTLLGSEPRAIIGVPIASAILWYLLSKRVRNYFRKKRTS